MGNASHRTGEPDRRVSAKPGRRRALHREQLSAIGRGAQAALALSNEWTRRNIARQQDDAWYRRLSERARFPIRRGSSIRPGWFGKVPIRILKSSDFSSVPLT